MRVFITGITGFIGSGLAAHLAARGHQVSGSTTGTPRSSAMVRWRLGDPVDQAAFRSIEVVVHAAHDMSRGASRSNIDGTVALARAASSAGAATQIYVSSYSAHAAAVTEYGISKRTLEEWFLSAGHAAVRPGLVIGPGGLYARVAGVVRKGWIVPVVSPRALVSLVASGDLYAGIAAMIESPHRGLARLYLDERVTMLELMREIRRSAGSRALLVPAPYRLALGAALLAEKLHLPSPVSVENVRGLRANQGVRDPGDLTRFVSNPLNLAEMVAAAKTAI